MLLDVEFIVLDNYIYMNGKKKEKTVNEMIKKYRSNTIPLWICLVLKYYTH